MGSGDTYAKTRRSAAAQAQVERLATARVVGAKTISRRSWSQKLALKGAGSAAFKPFLKSSRRARYEVAAFRIAALLEVRTVPVSTMRELPLHRLVGLLEKKDAQAAEALAKEALVNNRGQVAGAMIQWIGDLDRDGFRAMGGKKRLLKWLLLSNPIGEENELAREAAAMIVFDYVIGNWDRFSGGNVFLNPKGGGFVLIDNNGTFAPWSMRQEARMAKLLGGVERFPADLIEKLRQLDKPAVEKALASDPWHQKQRLLSIEEIGYLLARRNAVLAHVDRLASVHGRDSVLAFQ